MQVILDNNSKYIISKLESSGYEAFAVGGCVRDSLLGRTVYDYDITTSALPHETKRILGDYQIVETGIRHGTVGVVIGSNLYEITTYRKEIGYADSRHPDKVEFVNSITEDLCRRDFTINAIAYSPSFGIYDPFNGIEDINNRIIRAVGDPFERFSEDSLRILRALRFAATLGFDLEKTTSNAINTLANNVKKVSPERIYTELKKLICGNNAFEVIQNYRNALSAVIPVSNDISKLKKLPCDFAMRFAYICKDAAIDTLNNLRADNETKLRCKLLLNSSTIPSDIYELKKYISSLGKNASLDIAKYRRAIYDEDIEHITEALVNSNCCLFLKQLDINGDDLNEIGINGKEIGTTLRYLLSLVIEDKVNNQKSELLKTLNDK